MSNMKKENPLNIEEKDIYQDALIALERLSKEKSQTHILLLKIKTKKLQWLLVSIFVILITIFYATAVFQPSIYNKSTSTAISVVSSNNSKIDKRIDFISLIPLLFLCGSATFSGYKFINFSQIEKAGKIQIDKAKMIWESLSERIAKDS